ncbi:MAG: hypothetical protein ACRER2_02495 [Methylococcales bacterium]
MSLDLDLNISDFPQDQSIASFQTSEQLIEYVGGTFHGTSPLTLLQLTPMAANIAAYQQQGLLKIEGDNAILDASFKNKQLTINNQVIPLPL